jgi:3-hydroxyisobutyrate dehydrogenase-like beta-hydroxyacid dehydrogenase
MDSHLPGKGAAGIIGLGIIGNRVAALLRREGYHVWTWNRTLRTEPNFLSSPLDVAESARHIQIFVANGEALLDTLRTMAPALTPDHIIVNHATVSPVDTREAAAIVAGRHASFLDAPFTGSRDAAEAGQLVYYIGGDIEVLNRIRPQLEVSSRQILEVGSVGEATVLKIATNLITSTTIATLAEALALLDRNGVPLAKLSDALALNAIRSPVIDMKLPCMINGDFTPRFSLKNMFKDTRIALSMAKDADIELPATSAFAGIAMAGLQRGWADEDFSVIARFYDFPGTSAKTTADSPPTPSEQSPAHDPLGTPTPKKSLFGLLRSIFSQGK